MADNFNFVVKKVSLETVCGITSKIPANEHPEFAFAGKSNVGKSSLINKFCNRKNLCRGNPPFKRADLQGKGTKEPGTAKGGEPAGRLEADGIFGAQQSRSDPCLHRERIQGKVKGTSG